MSHSNFSTAAMSAGTGHISAVLGPTNTGKTHLAVERMLGHASGMIGLPLRLLAREIYDRVVLIKGRANVALITGEEKKVPPQAAYFICTVEAMPLDRDFDFVAIDEVQLAGDPERGHIFTDRILYARGKSETMFLGASTIKPWIEKLVPQAGFISRPRLSRLSYSGPKKLSRLPARSAIVTFSTGDVYAIAELIRRQRGGAAVVMGSLSPRTRNAQVEMYQSGEVDFLVATDAIGMGLNMDIDHVAFASTYKFDGRISRGITAAEIGQIAGRAGRHMNDGTFGTTANVQPLDEMLIEAVEDHRFDAIPHIRWRNRALDFTTIRDLLRSLEKNSGRNNMIAPSDPDDYLTLKSLSQDSDIREYSQRQASVRQLWQVCQIPDFRQTMHDVHVRLLKEIYLFLQKPGGKIPDDWIAAHLNKLKGTGGDIDTLATRIAHTRTWTYIAHIPEWMNDGRHWQEQAHQLENTLSDALHERLTQRFVDRRTAILVRKLKDRSQVEAKISDSGDVAVEGQYVGSLNGLRFAVDISANDTDAKTLRNVGSKAVGVEITKRAQSIAAAEDDQFKLDEQGQILWHESVIGRLAKGESVLKPKTVILASEQLNGPMMEAVQNRLGKWTAAQIEARLKPLVKLSTLPLEGSLRGIAFQVSEALGALPRFKLANQIRSLEKKDYGRLKFAGLRVGYEHVFLPVLLKPDPTELRCLLWGLFEERDVLPGPPPAGRVSFDADKSLSQDYYLTAGYAVLDGLAVRLDMLDRLAGMLRRASRGMAEPSKEQPKAKQPSEDKAEETSKATVGDDTDAAPKQESAEPSVQDTAEAIPAAKVVETDDQTAVPAAVEPGVDDNSPDTAVAPASEAEEKPEASAEPAQAEEKPDAQVAPEADASALSADVAKTESASSAEDKKKTPPKNLAFAPTHEMLSLVGTTRDQFTVILDKLGYDAIGEGEELQYKRKSFNKRHRHKAGKPPAKHSKGGQKKPGGKPFAPRKPAPKQKEIDPDSPFAILKDLTRR